MRALQIVGPRQVAVVDGVPEPEPGDGEVLVRCRHVSLCGSNIHPYEAEGRWAGADYPRPAGWDGHECVGVVAESRLDGWEPGALVLAHPLDYCGFAEAIRSTSPGLVRLPEGCDGAALTVAQPLATVLRAMRRIDLGRVMNRRCAVVGQGPMGLIFTHLLRHLGARQVIGIDLLDWRVDWARRLGATDGIDASAGNVEEAVADLTGGEMVDFCVEAVGLRGSIATAAHVVRRYGTLLVFGVTREDPLPFPMERVFRREMEIVTSVGAECVEYFHTAVQMLVDGQLDLAPLVTHRLPFDDGPRGYALYAGHTDGALKVVLDL